MEFTLALEFTFSSQPFLSSYMDIVHTPAGSHIIVRIRNCTNQQKLIDALKNKEISIYGVQQFQTNF